MNESDIQLCLCVSMENNLSLNVQSTWKLYWRNSTSTSWMIPYSRTNDKYIWKRSITHTMRSSHQNCWYVSTFYKLFLSFSMVVTLVYEPEETIGEIREQQIKKVPWLMCAFILSTSSWLKTELLNCCETSLILILKK